METSGGQGEVESGWSEGGKQLLPHNQPSYHLPFISFPSLFSFHNLSAVFYHSSVEKSVTTLSFISYFVYDQVPHRSDHATSSCRPACRYRGFACDKKKLGVKPRLYHNIEYPQSWVFLCQHTRVWKQGRNAYEVSINKPTYSIVMYRYPDCLLTWCNDTKISHSSKLLHKTPTN